MKKTVLFLTLCFLITTIELLSQTVNLNFPKFAGSHYYFTVFQGQNTDTISRGEIPKSGKLQIVFPERLKNYYGMCSWTLKQGGGLQFIVTPAGLTIECYEETPTTKSILYGNSPENDSLIAYQAEQQSIYDRINRHFYDRQNNASNVSPIDFELPALRNLYENFQNRIAQTNSYSAFYIQLNNYLAGRGQKLLTEQSDAPLFDREFEKYITEKVDMRRLYTSGLWNHLISVCFKLFPDEKKFGDAMKKILKRTKHQQTLELFANDLMMICEQFGWDEARVIIVDYLVEANRIPNPSGLVKVAFMLNKIKQGQPAPEIVGAGSPAGSIIIFYESGCDHCNEQIDLLIKEYKTLKAKGLKVISISTDTSEEVFKYHSEKFPWKDKLCDYKGFKGENFVRYGVFGTPTLYYIDKNGKVVDRKAKLEQIDINLK